MIVTKTWGQERQPGVAGSPCGWCGIHSPGALDFFGLREVHGMMVATFLSEVTDTDLFEDDFGPRGWRRALPGSGE